MGKILEKISEAPKLLRLNTLVFLPINLIVHVVSLATRDWYYQGNSLMYGLFETENLDVKTKISGRFLDDYRFYRFCQAGMILGLVLVFLAQLFAFLVILKKENTFRRLCLLGSSILASILTGVTWIVFVAKISDEAPFQSSEFEQFGYSFGLAIISSVLSFIVFLLTIFGGGIFSNNDQDRRPQFGGNHSPGFMQKPNFVPGGMYPGNEQMGRARSRSPMKGQAPPYSQYNQMGRGPGGPGGPGGQGPGPAGEDMRGPGGHQRMSRRDRNEEEIVANPGYLDLP